MKAPSRLKLALVIASSLFVAASADADEDGLPVISAGRESEVMALFKPIDLGGPMGNGWQLDALSVDPRFVRATALGPGGAKATLQLELPRRHASPETTPSFSVFREVAAAGDAKVLDPLVEAVRKNDNGKFWPLEAPKPRSGGLGPEIGTSNPVVRAFWFVVYHGWLGGSMMAVVIALCLLAARRERMARARLAAR